ncbi:MAG: 2-oxo acid dehydrogenase subunit E2 [Fimbriimonadaceae bacterium]|nr:2-oxo acid dehydrogenase subunit E2 [Fimbriimonadaceae bacterium]QYK59371.1 MAG: 2-oxo acid dehydrogenase subunit E2 [Fimbriimonadaceae bacterium]
MTEVIMPKMGDGMEEGTLVEWLKKPGDSVKSGEVIGTIQTDKATLELESPGSGTLTGFLIEPGQTVPVGVPIAAILKNGESLPENWGTGSAPKPAEVAEPVAAAAAPAAKSAEVSVSTVPSDSRVKASPLARKIATELGVDLSAVAGTGPGGRVTEKDVRAAVEQQGMKLPTAPQIVSLAPSAEDRKVPLTPLRRITAQRTHQAKSEAPHFYVTVEVDVDRVMALRDFFKEEESGSVSVNDFVVAACARALRAMPEVNASFGGDHVLVHGGVHIGVAVAVDDGLTVPVLKNADQLSLRQIAQSVRDLAGRARENKLSLDELSGSTFSISNMGMLDVDVFAAIVNTPNAGILAISSARRKPVVTDSDELEVRWRMNITGSFDHRVVDGAIGAKFVNAVRSFLENPTRLLS